MISSQLNRTYQELSNLQQENARIQGELNRYTTSSNPLPRPPEHIPLVTSLPRDPAASATNSVQRSGAPLGLGLPSVVAPTTQSRSSSNGSGGSTGSRRAPSVHFAEPSPPTERQPKSRYKISVDGEELRQEKTRRPHLIVPGAPSSQRIIPPRLDGADLDVTPRPPITIVPRRPDLTGMTYYEDGEPLRLEESITFVGPDGPVELTMEEKKIVRQNSIEQAAARAANRGGPVAFTPVTGLLPPGPATVVPPFPPPVIPPPPVFPPTMAAGPAYETRSARMQRVVPAEAPVSGRSPLAWRPGPANKEGYVKAYLPHLGGVGWIPEEEAAKLPVRRWGTESRYAYVLAKEPEEVDDEWRRDHNGASPGPNPLRLIGVPEAPVAGPSRSAIQRTQHDAPPESSAGPSTLFRDQPRPSDRVIPASGNGSSASLSSLDIFAPASSTSRAERSPGHRRAASNAEPLGLNLTSLPMPGPPRESEDPEIQPSPASTWGTMESRNSSLGNLGLNNFGEPGPFTRAQSLEQLPIGELNGGPIVLTDAITPRQGSSSLGEARSISGRSAHSRDHHAGAAAPGLLLNPSAGSSRVVTSLQDLEDVNRSLQQVADSQARGPSRHSQRSSHSSRHSSHPSMSGDEGEVMVGSRTGLALYSARPSQHASNASHVGRSSNDPSPPAQSRPHSGGSALSHRAESAHSHSTSLSRQSSHSQHSSYSTHSSHSAHSAGTSKSHRSATDQRRARRASNASMLNHAPEPATWATIPSDMQPYGPSRGPYTSDARPPPSQESIPRSLRSNGDGLGLTFEAPSTSAAVTGNGEQAAGIHAPRPVNGHRPSQLIGSSWNARSGH